MEDGLTDQPQEVIQSRPELGHVGQRLGAAAKQIDLTDEVAETQNQTAADECRDDGGKNFAQCAHDALYRVLVGLGRALDRVATHALDARVLGKFLIEGRNVVADDDLILSGLGERTLDARNRFDGLFVGLFRVHKHETHARHAVGNCLDVGLAANFIQQRLDCLLVFCHKWGSSSFICFLVLNLFKQVILLVHKIPLFHPDCKAIFDQKIKFFFRHSDQSVCAQFQDWQALLCAI